MKKTLLFTFLFALSYTVYAQEPTGYKQPKDFQLNKNLEDLGITQKAINRTKALLNPPINIALFAVDRREADDRANSDVIMIISINQQDGKVKMASIMRDTYVNIEGVGMDKLNSAYAL